MPKQDHFARFDEWWDSIGMQGRARLDEATARTSFVAGSRIAVKSKPHQYRFQCGKWKVAVTASSLPEAKAKAIDILDRRAKKLMTTPPLRGWRLDLLTAGK